MWQFSGFGNCPLGVGQTKGLGGVDASEIGFSGVSCISSLCSSVVVSSSSTTVVSSSVVLVSSVTAAASVVDEPSCATVISLVDASVGILVTIVEGRVHVVTNWHLAVSGMKNVDGEHFCKFS